MYLPGMGTVYLVGAGPGDPGLLTLRAAELIRSADVLAYDALIPPAILAMAAEDAERIPVGRRHGDGSAGYRIHPAVLERARAGRDVVRLKTGDPFVFGRGGEEAEELARSGIRFQVVPGVSAAQGASAYAGIPLTHRRYASDVIFATGHDADGSHASLSRWSVLGRDSGTLVLYMAAARLAGNVRRLIAAGRDPDTPAACIVAATWPEQRIVAGTLRDLPEKMRGQNPELPALVVIGDVVRLRQVISWWESSPLRGRRILVARAQPGRSRIAAALRARGAEVAESPTLHVGPVADPAALDGALDSLGAYDGAVFACRTGVEGVLTRWARRGGTHDAFRQVPLVAIGDPACGRLREAGLDPAVAIQSASVEALSSVAGYWRGRTFLLFASDRGRPGLVADLGALGAKVTEVAAYSAWQSAALWRPERFDLLVAPSSTAAKAVLRENPALRAIPALAIGPRTEAALRGEGARTVYRADQDTAESLVDWVVRRFGRVGEERATPEFANRRPLAATDAGRDARILP